jgi:hypothetical protein
MIRVNHARRSRKQDGRQNIRDESLKDTPPPEQVSLMDIKAIYEPTLE